MASVDNAAIIWSVITVIVAVGLVSVTSTSEIIPDANNIDKPTYGDSNIGYSTLKIETEKAEYEKNDTVIISGSVDKILQGYPVTVQVIDPDGNLVAIAQIDVSNDMRFGHKIVTGGQLWSNDGDYTIKAMYGEKNTAETSFRFITPSVPKTTDVFSMDAGSRVFSVGYSITNAAVRDMVMDSDCLCLTVTLDTQNDGILVVDLPRGLVDSKISNGGDDSFIILMDGIEIPYEKISSDSQSRTIRMEFTKNASEIEIIGTNPI